MLAGIAPWPAIGSDDHFPLTRQGADVLSAALEEWRAGSTAVTAEDMPKMFPSPPDSAALTGEFAEWLASAYREAFAAGITGARDDNLACYHDWGFDPAKARRVIIWQGEQDPNVGPAHAYWLAEHIPGAELRMLPDEGHISIGLHLPEIIGNLRARIGR